MGTTSSQYDLPAPAGGDDADVPDWVEQLRDRLEEILVGADPADALGLPVVGDFKDSSRSASHGRWLLCDGRELTQAQIEAELSLDAGQALALVTLWGTGAPSQYGAAAVGKIQLPDPQGRVRMNAGAGSGLTSRARGDSGGAETVTLTGAQSGIAAHTHLATQAAHNHTATQAAHNHTATQGDHSHSATVSAHTHAVGTLQTGMVAAHDHSSGTYATDDSGTHDHEITYAVASKAGPGTNVVSALFGGSTVVTELGGDHSHDVTGTSGSDGAHNHTITGATASTTPTASVATASAGAITVGNATPAITVDNSTPAITVQAVAAADAASSHPNMPPYLVLGSLFVRV
jgi:microcystin-dependent protein